MVAKASRGEPLKGAAKGRHGECGGQPDRLGYRHAAYNREGMAERKPYFLYIDEFRSFCTAAFADMLSERRKYGLGPAATTQYGTRLSETVRESIFGNVGTIIAFRVGVTAAAILERQFGGGYPYRPRPCNLPNFECYAKLMVDGTQTKPISAKTLPPEMHIAHTA